MSFSSRILLVISISTFWSMLNVSAAGLHLWPVFALMWVIGFGHTKPADSDTKTLLKPGKSV